MTSLEEKLQEEYEFQRQQIAVEFANEFLRVVEEKNISVQDVAQKTALSVDEIREMLLGGATWFGKYALAEAIGCEIHIRLEPKESTAGRRERNNDQLRKNQERRNKRGETVRGSE